MGKRIWNREIVLECIRSLHSEGCDLSYGNVIRAELRLVRAAERIIGTWPSAVEASGIDYSPYRERAVAIRMKWSKERIIEKIQNLVARNELLRASVIAQKYTSLYSAACSPRHFGSWSNALKAAGVEVNSGRQNSRTEHTILLAGWRATLLMERASQIVGRESVRDEASLKRLAPGLHIALMRHFRSWSEVLTASETLAMPQEGGS